MQRILSLGTLAVLGGLAWLFLRGGGLENSTSSPSDGFAEVGGSLTDLFNKQTENIDATDSVKNGAIRSGSRSDTSSSATVRIASFNVEYLDEKKSSSEFVMKALALIIRNFHIVALQGVQTESNERVANLIRLANSPVDGVRRRFDHLVGPLVGNSSPQQQYAFLFDEDRVQCDFSTSYTIRDPENLLHREPLVASFRTRGVPVDRAFTFTLVNVHIDEHAIAQELDVLAEAYRVVRLAGRNEDDVIMLGHFPADERQLGRIGQIPGMIAVLRETTTDTRRTGLFDNFVFHQPSTTEYVGRRGVFDFMRKFNLTQEAALSISQYLPIWAEFSVYELDYAGRISSRLATQR